MLECQRNGESSFAVSASTCIHKEEGVKQSDEERTRRVQHPAGTTVVRRWALVRQRQVTGGKGLLGGGQGKGERLQRRERERERERETRARAQGLCLLRCCLPCSFPRSSINETRVQSRRMSNKYVSCSLLLLLLLHPLPPPTRHRPPPATPAASSRARVSPVRLSCLFSPPFFPDLPHPPFDSSPQPVPRRFNPSTFSTLRVFRPRLVEPRYNLIASERTAIVGIRHRNETTEREPPVLFERTCS